MLIFLGVGGWGGVCVFSVGLFGWGFIRTRVRSALLGMGVAGWRVRAPVSGECSVHRGCL